MILHDILMESSCGNDFQLAEKVASVFKPTAVLRNVQSKRVRTTSSLTLVLTIPLADLDPGRLVILRLN